MLKDYIEIKVATPTDALPLGYVGRTTFTESWSYLYTPEDIKVYNDSEFSTARLEKDILNAANIFVLAFMNGKTAGYAKMRRDRNPIQLDGSAAIEIERIYALKEFHGKKIGYSLMNRCLELARAEKLDWIWLGVNESNTRALNFYKRFDFEVFGTKIFKLCDVEDVDLMMKKKL